MTLDHLTKYEIRSRIEETKVQTHKLGRQGYALILSKDFTGHWYWTIETQNGVEVAASSISYSRRYTAIRSAKRLVSNISNIYTEDANGNRI